jgi:hypothetical protein
VITVGRDYSDSLQNKGDYGDSLQDKATGLISIVIISCTVN